MKRPAFLLLTAAAFAAACTDRAPTSPRGGAPLARISAAEAASALELVIDVLDGPPTPGDKLFDAIAKLEIAVRELRKTPPDNQAALGAIEGAVGDLEAAVDAGLLSPDGAEQLIDELMPEAARVAHELAVAAIDDAKARRGDPQKIVEAEVSLAAGKDLQAGGKFKDAVNKYKDALAKAEGAGCDCTEQRVGSGGGTIVTNRGGAGVQIPAGAIPEGKEIVVTIQPHKLAALEPCFSAGLQNAPSQQLKGCYDFKVFDAGEQVLFEFKKVVTVALCAELPEDFSGDPELLELHQFDEEFDEEEGGEVKALPNAPAPFLTCDEGRLGSIRGVLDRLASLFGPRPLYAATVLDVGVGGLTKRFGSIIGWGMPAEVTTPKLLTPFQDAVIEQNNPNIGCSLLSEGGETRGYGFQIVFAWTDAIPTTGTSVDSYELVAVNTELSPPPPLEEPIPIVHEFIDADDGTEFTFTSCNAFVIDANLEGWRWQVRPQLSNENAGSWSVGTFSFAPCRLASGAPCNAPPALPDLVISSGEPTVTPAVVTPGSNVSLSAATVKNQGDGPVPIGRVVNIEYRLSTDATITGTDVFLGSSFITNTGMSLGQEITGPATIFQIPAATTPGSYWIGIRVDQDNDVVESNEANNFVSTPLTVAPTIFQATFTTDASDAAPGTPQTGTWAFIGTSAGTVLVKAALGDLTNKPVVLDQVAGLLGGVDLIGHVAGTPPSSGVYLARFRALWHSESAGGVFVLRDASTRVVCSVGIGHGPDGRAIRFNNVVQAGLSWTPDVSQSFEVTVDLDEDLCSLTVNGAAVAGAQGVGFFESAATNLRSVELSHGGTFAQTSAWDNIVVAAVP